MKTLKRMQNLIAFIGFWVAIVLVDGAEASPKDYVSAIVLVTAVILMLLGRHYVPKVRED